MYRLVAPPPDFDVSLTGWAPEIRDLDCLVLSLRQAVLDGDWDRATLVSSDIAGSISYAMAWGMAANQAIARAYSQLLLAFSVVIVLTSFAIWVSHGMMLRLRKRGEEDSAFSRAVLMAQEEERGRISMELHDTVVQDMRRLSRDMDKIVGIDERAEREELYAEASVLQTAIADSLRDICNNLVPLDFGPRELPDALRRLCLDFAERTGVDCRMETANGACLDFRDRESSLHIFRMVQEALTNVEKHAEATKATVELRREAGGNIVIIVVDNGKGLKPVTQKGPSSDGTRLGIRGMRVRAMLLGGSITVNGRPEGSRGTRIVIRVPPINTLPNTCDTETGPTPSVVDALLIDDHPSTNKGVAYTLRETGRFPVLGQAKSLDGARRFIEKADRLPALIVLDIQLGRENGLDFLPFLKTFCLEKQVPMPPVLVQSTFDDPFRVETALGLGALGYVPKNADEAEMLKAVDTVLRGEPYVPREHLDRLNRVSGKYLRLTKREIELIDLVKQNKTNDQIAEAMGVSKRSVETYISRIYVKTGAQNRLELMGL